MRQLFFVHGKTEILIAKIEERHFVS